MAKSQAWHFVCLQLWPLHNEEASGTTPDCGVYWPYHIPLLSVKSQWWNGFLNLQLKSGLMVMTCRSVMSFGCWAACTLNQTTLWGHPEWEHHVDWGAKRWKQQCPTYSQIQWVSQDYSFYMSSHMVSTTELRCQSCNFGLPQKEIFLAQDKERILLSVRHWLLPGNPPCLVPSGQHMKEQSLYWYGQSSWTGGGFYMRRTENMWERRWYVGVLWESP